MRNLLSDNFKLLAGLLEVSALQDSNAVIYCISDHSPSDRDDAIRVVNMRTAEVNFFLLSMWLLKDNSVNIELGFLEWPLVNKCGSNVTSNTRAIRFANADGGIKEIEFTDSEVREARDIYSTLFAANITTRDDYQGYVIPEDINRLSRVFYYTQGARGSSNLSNRISTYVTCFEALFCTDSSEMAHKLSERMAFFLGETPTRRLEIFKQVKLAYNIRSKSVHGDKISKKLAEQVLSISLACDQLLRKALIKILENPSLQEVFSGSSQALEDYFTNLVLGGAERLH